MPDDDDGDDEPNSYVRGFALYANAGAMNGLSARRGGLLLEFIMHSRCMAASLCGKRRNCSPNSFFGSIDRIDIQFRFDGLT